MEEEEGALIEEEEGGCFAFRRSHFKFDSESCIETRVSSADGHIRREDDTLQDPGLMD